MINVSNPCCIKIQPRNILFLLLSAFELTYNLCILKIYSASFPLLLQLILFALVYFFVIHLIPLLPLSIGCRRWPFLQCHLSDQNWVGRTAVLSELHHRGGSGAADSGFWRPGSNGHGCHLYISGGGCGPWRCHASRWSYRHSPHQGKKDSRWETPVSCSFPVRACVSFCSGHVTSWAMFPK